MQLARRPAGTPCSEVTPSLLKRTISPGFTSRTYSAPHDIESAGLGGNDPAAIVGKLAHAQRADAVRVAEGVEAVGACEHHGVGALQVLHGEANALAQVMSLLGNVADRLRRHLGVGSRAKLDAVINQAGTQAVRVHERAVVREGDERLVDCRDMGWAASHDAAAPEVE